MNDRCVLTPRAEQGLREAIGRTEEEFGAAVALQALARIEEALDAIARMPGIGHRREDLSRDPAVRFWSVGPSLIAYRTKGRQVQVLFIERGEGDDRLQRMVDAPPP